MVRGALIFLFVLAVASVALSMAGDPGHATLIWLGRRVDTTASVAALIIGVLTLVALAVWRIALWIAEQPRRTARARAETRRRQGAEVLTRGFVSLAAGDGAEARRCAQKASDLAEDSPGLVRILTAMAAEQAGDGAAAHAAYTAMLGFPEMRLAGRRGLMQLAQAQGDTAAALDHAQAAYDLTRTARWAWRALFEARLEAGQWEDALGLVDTGLQRKILTPVVAERARAALMAATAASLEHAEEARTRDHAMDFATRAAKSCPAFAPGPVIAARLLSEAGKVSRAEDVVEQAWAASPHPALWLAYRDLRTDETPRERAKRLQTLIDRNPDHRESRILAVEQALLAADKARLRLAVAAVAEEPPTQRLGGLRARAARVLGQADEARAWVARAAAAPQEPDWSDLDPEGRAFAYAQADWTRLVSVWAETGELVHPRFERHERALSELPELPAHYETSAPFVSAAESGAGFAPIPDDPGPFADALAGPAPEPEPTAAPARARRPRPRRAGGLGKGGSSV